MCALDVLLSSSDIKAMGDVEVEVQLKRLNECVCAHVYMCVREAHTWSCTQQNAWRLLSARVGLPLFSPPTLSLDIHYFHCACFSFHQCIRVTQT